MDVSGQAPRKIFTRSLRRYRDDPVGFVQEKLGGGLPYPKQVEVLRAVARSRRVSVVGCNSCGKDWVAARVVLWWTEARDRAKAVVTGPTQRQVEEVLWREMRAARSSARGLLGKMYARRYVIDDHRFALGFSTDHPFNLQGFHSPELLVVVTEAHAVRQEHMDALKRLNPSLLLLSGNPLTLSGEFYDSHHRTRYMYDRVSISAYDTPNVRLGRDDVVPGMVTPQDIQERLREWGENHSLYLSSVLGRFPESLVDSLVTMPSIREAVEQWRAGLSDPCPPCIIGLDVARFGSDKTVFCLRRGDRVERLVSMEQADTMAVAGQAVALVREHQAKAVFVDAAGVGGGVVDRLRELGQPVVEVQLGSAARNPVRYLNRRTELFLELRRRFVEGRIAIPDDQEMIAQLVGLRYSYSSGGQFRMEGKEEMRSRGVSSPDRADALALAFMELPSVGIWV